MEDKRYGKYRAYVIDVDDPEERGRIRVKCPEVLGQYASDWCEMCAPGVQQGTGDIIIPEVGESVWVEFEEGDPAYPVFTGSWYFSRQTPFHSEPDYASALQKGRVIGYKGSKINMDKQGKMSLVSDEHEAPLNANAMSYLEMFGFSRSMLYQMIVSSVAGSHIDTRSPASL